jgi:hypothetical protein
MPAVVGIVAGKRSPTSSVSRFPECRRKGSIKDFRCQASRVQVFKVKFVHLHKLLRIVFGLTHST